MTGIAKGPTVLSCVVAGVACAGTCGLLAAAGIEICVQTPVFSPLHWLLSTEAMHFVAHLPFVVEAQESFPRLFKLLGLVLTGVMLVLSFIHLKHLWSHGVKALVWAGDWLALGREMLSDFGAYCGLVLVKLLKLLRKLFGHDHAHDPGKA